MDSKSGPGTPRAEIYEVPKKSKFDLDKDIPTANDQRMTTVSTKILDELTGKTATVVSEDPTPAALWMR